MTKMQCVIAGEDPGIVFSTTYLLSIIRSFAYNILKNLEDNIVGDKEIPELDQCSECNNEVLTHPPKAFSILSCGHIFHRICIEKKLLLTMPNTCPFPDCGTISYY